MRAHMIHLECSLFITLIIPILDKLLIIARAFLPCIGVYEVSQGFELDCILRDAFQEFRFALVII